jgi:protein O-mannosyl-transferase
VISFGLIPNIIGTAVNDTWTKILICVFLMVATFSIYAQVQDHKFINFDDDKYVTNNLSVQAGLTSENIIKVFTKTHFGLWVPITSLSYMIDYEIYGLNPKGYLLTNLFFHITNSLLLFVVLFRMTGAIWQSAFVATMFTLHPLNVESVAWISDRKNVLSTLFWLLTMWAYIDYVKKSTLRRYGLVLLFLTLGLMSKPMLVTLPFALLLLDYWPLRRFKYELERNRDETSKKITAKSSEFFQLVFEKIPLFLLAAGSSIVTVLANNIAFGVQTLSTVSLKARLTNAMVTYLEYLEKTIWPSELSILYPHPENALPLWQGIVSGMALMSITIVVIKFIRKRPYFSVGWFWYLGTLLPVIGILRVGGHVMADRYVYVPLIGIFIIISWGVPELVSKWRYKEKVLSVSAGIIIFTLMIITWKQVSHWENSITVFKHAISVTDKKYPNLSTAHNNLGVALFASGKKAEAIPHYKMAVKLKPNTETHNNLGVALSAGGKKAEAIANFRMAIKLNANYDKPHNNLGIALAADGKNEEAITHYKLAIKVNPNYADAHYNLGVMLSSEQKNAEAIFHYKMAIKLNPGYTSSYYNLGLALSSVGKNKEAISHFRTAISLNPNHTNAHYNLGYALVKKGDMEGGVYHYRETLRLRPNFVMARDNLELALDRLHELD